MRHRFARRSTRTLRFVIVNFCVDAGLEAPPLDRTRRQTRKRKGDDEDVPEEDRSQRTLQKKRRVALNRRAERN